MKKILLILFIFILAFVPNVYATKPNASPTPSPTPIANKIICIDPGHGGNDPGAVNSDLTEKWINLEVAKLLESKLLSATYSVEMTRRDNETTLSNADRYNFCNSKNASILISIHHNGSTDLNLNYTSALYMKKPDQKLASIIARSISQQLGLENRGITRFASGVLLKANMPATISEGFFITNMDEYNRIKSGGRLEQEASAIYSAIQTYFSTL